MGESAFLTVRQISDRLQVRTDTVRMWLQRGVLRGVKLPGGDWRVKPEDFEALLERIPQRLTNVPG